MTVLIPVECPHCNSTDVVKNGKSAEGKQRFLCRNDECSKTSFILNNSYPGRTREVKEKIIELTLNGCGVRDIARTLKVSTNTVTKTLREKGKQIRQVNPELLQELSAESIEVDIVRLDEETATTEPSEAKKKL